MAFTLIPDVLLIIETVLCFGFAIFAFVRALYITRNISYLHFLMALILAFAGYIFVSIPGNYVPEDNKLNIVILFIILANIFLGLSFFLFLNTIIMIKEDRLPAFSHFVALIIGASMIIIATIDEEMVSYNYSASFWQVDYGSVLFLVLASIAIVIFLVYFSLYLICKFEKFKNSKQFDVSFLGFAILTVWMVTITVDVMKVIRHFLFPLGMFMFGLAVFLDKLNFLVTKRIPDEIILLSRFDHPVIRYNIKEDKIDRNHEEINLFLAGGKIISESMNGYEEPKDMKLMNREIRYVDLKGYQVIVVGSKIDRNAIGALHTAFRHFRKKTDLDYLGASTVLSEPDERAFVESFTKFIKRIDATKKNENKRKKKGK